MTPSARLAAAAQILDSLTLDRPVDPQLKTWARANRFAGSKDRRAIADRVYTCLRRQRSAARQGGGDHGRALVFGSLRVQDGLSPDEIDALCTGGYGLEPLTTAERAALAAHPDYTSPAEALDWPDWLWPEAQRAFGADVEPELDALRQRAAFDVRANLLRTTRDGAREALSREGIEASPMPLSPTALRLATGTALTGTKAYRDGLVEPQDAASQAVADLIAALPGETVLDFCAGAGGKTLALAAAMQNRGRVLAHDVDPRRMAVLPERAARAGATIIERVSADQIASGSCDRVLVDAPCSGSGSWRRDPAGKWRLTPARLDALKTAQHDALSRAADAVKPGGFLVYATCSILGVENDDQVERFLHEGSDFNVKTTRAYWPHRDQADGFYAALLQRKKDGSIN